MAMNQTEFGVSFRALLSEAMRALGWPEPNYYQSNLERNAAVLVLQRGVGPNACLFRGPKTRVLADSEENAAEQAVDFLVQKKQIVVHDVNLEKREMFKACCRFYKAKRVALENAVEGRSMSQLSTRAKMKAVVPTCLPKKVLADLWGIWLQIVEAYQVEVDEVDFITQAGGGQVCCFTVKCPGPSPRVQYFIGDTSETIEGSKYSLAKKAISYLQSVYGFSVKDANFNRMRYSEIQCGFERTRYVDAKQKNVCVFAELASVPLFVAGDYHTPEGPAFGIRSGLTVPPPPKRQRPFLVGSTWCSANHTDGVANEDAVSEQLPGDGQVIERAN